MRPAPFLSFVLGISACDKGSDSAGGEESDADTDSDTDSDTDTDTDTDTGFGGIIEMVLSDDYGGKFCDTTIELTGTPYTGDCPHCDFAFKTTGTVLEESGYDCDYERYPASFVNGEYWAERWLAFSSEYYIGSAWPTYYNVLLQGFAVSGSTAPAFWWRQVHDEWYPSSASSSPGLLEWAQFYDVSITEWTVDYACDATYGLYGEAYYGGAYSSEGSTVCSYGQYYDLWSFVAYRDDGITISVNTVSDDTTFDPHLVVTDGTMCFVGSSWDSFACSYAPTAGTCPSFKMTVTGGAEYDLLVFDNGACAGSTADYKIVIDAVGDPALTLEDSHVRKWYPAKMVVTGSVTIP